MRPHAARLRGARRPRRFRRELLRLMACEDRGNLDRGASVLARKFMPVTGPIRARLRAIDEMEFKFYGPTP